MTPLGGATMGKDYNDRPSLTTADGQSCFTECMWEGGAPSSLHRNANLAFIFIRVPV